MKKTIRVRKHRRKGRVVKAHTRKLNYGAFTPFKWGDKAQELSAAKRFGGQNLKGLKKIGQGRDREVFALDNDKVLKIVRNPGGFTQNASEKDLDFLDLGKHYETGLDYTVTARNEELSPQNKRILGKIRKEVSEIPLSRQGFSNNYSRDDSQIRAKLSSSKVFEDSGIPSDILNYDFNAQELFANRQWGQDKEGNLRLNDAGALNDDQTLSKYRVKDFQQQARMDPSRVPWQLKDFEETKRQRRLYGKKGNYKNED